MIVSVVVMVAVLRAVAVAGSKVEVTGRPVTMTVSVLLMFTAT